MPHDYEFHPASGDPGRVNARNALHPHERDRGGGLGADSGGHWPAVERLDVGVSSGVSGSSWAEPEQFSVGGHIDTSNSRNTVRQETAFDAVFQKIEAIADLVMRRSMAVAEIVSRLHVSADLLVGTRPEDPRKGEERGDDYPRPVGALAQLHAKLGYLNTLVADMPVTELADQAARFEGLA